MEPPQQDGTAKQEGIQGAGPAQDQATVDQAPKQAMNPAQLNDKVISAVLETSEVGKALEAAGLDKEALKTLLPGQIEKFQKDILLTQITNRFLMELLRDIHIKNCGRSRTEIITEKYWRLPLRKNGFHDMIGERPPAQAKPADPGQVKT